VVVPLTPLLNWWGPGRLGTWVVGVVGVGAEAVGLVIRYQAFTTLATCRTSWSSPVCHGTEQLDHYSAGRGGWANSFRPLSHHLSGPREKCVV